MATEFSPGHPPRPYLQLPDLPCPTYQARRESRARRGRGRPWPSSSGACSLPRLLRSRSTSSPSLLPSPSSPGGCRICRRRSIDPSRSPVASSSSINAFHIASITRVDKHIPCHSKEPQSTQISNHCCTKDGTERKSVAVPGNPNYIQNTPMPLALTCWAERCGACR